MSNTAALSMRTLSDRDQIRAAKAEMNAAFDAAITASRDGLVYAAPSSLEARHFIEVLGKLLDTEETGYECIPECLGTEWLFAHTNSFAMLVEGSPADFLRQHLNRYAGNFLLCRRLLLTIDEAELPDFVRDVLAAATPFNDSWMQVLLDFNIPQSMIVELVLEKLRSTHVDLKYNMADFVRYDFARHGSQYEIHSHRRVPYLTGGRPTYWSVMTDEQLFEAIDICNDKVPGILFKEDALRNGLQARFVGLSRGSVAEVAAGKQIITDLFVKYANKLDSLNGVDYDTFDMLPPQVQVELVKKFDGASTVFLVRAAMAALDWELFDKYVGVLALKDKADYAHVLINLQRVLRPQGVSLPIDAADHPDERVKLAASITETLETNARWAGFILGIVRERNGDHYVTDSDNGWVYIHDWLAADRNSRYFPKEGDYVMFRKPQQKYTKRGGIRVIFIKLR